MRISKVTMIVAFAILLLIGCSKSYKNVMSYSGTGYTEQNHEGAITNPEGSDNQEEMYVEHETTPQFPGGAAAMLSYIYDNLNYPQSSYDKNIEGRVVLRFLIRKTGEVDSVKIVRGKDPLLDAEAIRLVSGFPRFVPATFDLVPVDRWLTLPIKFNKADYDERHSKRYPARQSDNSDD